MQTEVPPPALNTDEIDRLIEGIYQGIAKRGLELPALFFLEAHLPVTSLVHTLGIFLEPFALPLFGAERIAQLRLFLSERKHLEKLIAKLEDGPDRAKRAKDVRAQKGVSPRQDVLNLGK